MNVLILTPDRVGSTMLQRVLTVYMLRKGFDKPVINLHELSNSLVDYYNTTLNQTVLGKPADPNDWGYGQSLSEVIEMLESADHYKTSRLAHYHLVRRQDPIAEQVKFYDYLNKNFYIISCQRENLFEHALSWIIFAHSKKLNVYSHVDKVDTFQNLYKNKIKATRQEFESKLNDYKEYVKWTSMYFNVQSFFRYEDFINNLEEYILGLDFMKDATNNSWKDMFGADFDTWNKVHKTIPDLFLKDSDGDESMTMCLRLEDWKSARAEHWPELPPPDIKDLPVEMQEEVNKHLILPTLQVTHDQAKFLKQNLPAYTESTTHLESLVTNGFMPTSIPIKLQTFAEKKLLVENFDECIGWYNEWVEANNFGKPFEYTDNQDREELKFNDFSNLLEQKID